MRKFALAAAAVAACGTAFAQSQMKPGLWEITHQTQTGSGQMEQQHKAHMQQIANLPPEQRKMVEEMLGKQGVKLSAAGPSGMALKVCMTKDMVERHELPAQQGGDCKTTQQPMGKTTKISFTCTNPPSSGEGQFTFNSNESYSMKMLVKTSASGRPETMTMEGSGKWLGADCGDVKPMRAPAR